MILVQNAKNRIKDSVSNGKRMLQLCRSNHEIHDDQNNYTASVVNSYLPSGAEPASNKFLPQSYNPQKIHRQKRMQANLSAKLISTSSVQKRKCYVPPLFNLNTIDHARGPSKLE
jgi:hypothetical protein